MSIKHLLATFFLMSLIVRGASASPSAVCSDLFYSEANLAVPKANLAEQVARGYQSPNVKAYIHFEYMKTMLPALKNDRVLTKAIERLIEDESLSSMHLVLERVLEATHVRVNKIGSPQTIPRDVFHSLLREELRVQLTNFMPERMARKRSSFISSPKLDKFMLMRALGQMTHKESLEALIGKNGLRNVSYDSLVGRFITEARKSDFLVDTFVGTFKKGPGYTGRGEEKLFLTVTPRTMHIAEKIFGSNPHLLIHNHESYQNTLRLYHAGTNASYAKYNAQTPFIMFKKNFAPMVVLSGIEASNTINYFTLGAFESGRSKYPWALKKLVDGQEKSSYCRIGGYNSCTHWFGEMPIGENRVDKYTLPGEGYDSYTNHEKAKDPTVEDQSAVRIGNVGTYTHFVSSTAPYEVGTQTREDRLTRIVWTEGKGREQLWSLLNPGNEKSIAEGEFANPGWVAYNLLSNSSSERVPVVLVYRDADDISPFDQLDVDELALIISAK